MDEQMKELFKQVRAHLQELESAQTMTVRQVDQMKANLERVTQDMGLLRNSVTLAHTATTALGGTFASIEQMLTEQAAWRAKMEARVEASEKKAS